MTQKRFQRVWGWGAQQTSGLWDCIEKEYSQDPKFGPRPEQSLKKVIIRSFTGCYLDILWKPESYLNGISFLQNSSKSKTGRFEFLKRGFSSFFFSKCLT